MGSSPESARFLLQQLLCRPHTVHWSAPRFVVVNRGHNRKLGFHFKTYPCQETFETVTVVVRIKDDCHIVSGLLHVGDRIVGVGSAVISNLQEALVKHVFDQSRDQAVLLQVCTMSRNDPNSQIKRFLSVNSSASGGSLTASVDSSERPQVKRFQKSSSTETPPPPSPSTAHPRSPAPSTPTPTLSSSRVAHSGVVDTPPLARRPLPCPPRECLTGHPSPPSASPVHSPHLSNFLHQHHHHHHHTHHSLPDRMDGDIVLPDDIVLCEADGPTSLPPVLTPLPNTPTPTLNSQVSSGAFVTKVSTGIGGASAMGGGGSGESPSSGGPQQSLGVEVCRAPDCGAQRVCLWHKCVLSCPQYVVWEAFTKTVVLEKGGHTTFGFKYKVKKYDDPPAEVFALVTEVTAGGVAWNLLLPGDWIRSINGNPLSNAKEAHKPDFRSLSTLRLVIQRPEGLSQKGVPKVRQFAGSMGIQLYIPPPAPLPPSDAAASSPPRPPHTSDSNTHPLSGDHRSRYLDRRGGGGSVDDVGRAAAVVPREPRCQEGALFDPLLDQYPRGAQSPGEHIPLTPILSTPVLVASPPPAGDEQGLLPLTRLVVCGAHGSASDFVRGLVGERGGVDVDPEAPVQSFRLSFHHAVESGTTVRSQLERFAALMEGGRSQPNSAGEGGGQGRQEEGDVRCLNVEVYVINDERFFHHCCSWLLPSAPLLLVLTFHVQKLLNQPQVETRRLAALMNTWQACTEGTTTSSSSPSSHPLLYGVSSGSQPDVSAEEVQVMFYVTDSGSRLLEQHGLAVSVAVPTCGQSVATTRRAVFSACRERLCRTVSAPQCVARVVDALWAVGGVKMFRGEVNGLVSQALGHTDPAMVRSVVTSLLDAGCLLPCSGSSRGRREGGGEQDYLLPFNTFQALTSLLVKPLLDTHSPVSRQRWFTLITTGRISRPDLVELLAGEDSSLPVDVIERLGIVFSFQPPSSSGKGDSGFAEDTRVDFVIPYFLQDVGGEGEGEREGFVVKFGRRVSWRGYYDLLCKLSALPAVEGVLVQGQCSAVVRYNGLQLCLLWRKDSGCDSMLVCVNRSQASGEKLTAQELERLLSCVIPPSLPFTVQVEDGSSPSSHLPSSAPHPTSPRPDSPTAHTAVGPRDQDPLEETYVKPVVEVVDGSLEERSAYSHLPLTVLPWSLLNQAAILLTINMPTGHDWKSVAEKAGKSVAEIYAYEVISTREVPAMNFLREWILTGRVQQFLDILDSLDRPDVRDLILDFLRSKKDGSWAEQKL
ncbi:uncharacterized protein LOC143299365 isoform X2 [Babylonia areolata]